METGQHLPSREELMLVHDFIMLPMLLDIVEKHIAKMELSHETLKDLYIKSLRKVQNTIHTDLVKVRADMKRIGIKVWDDPHHRDFTSIRYKMKIRGYEDEFGIMREVMKARLGTRLGGYIDGMFK